MKQTINIEKIIAGGKGLARLTSGQVVMVDGVLANETVVIRETGRHASYIEGEIVEILSPSPSRIKPQCPLYGECGGCDLQHGDYQEQLTIKTAIVSEAMARAGITLGQETVEKTVPCQPQWGYRQRLRLKLDNRGNPGFFKKQTNALIAVSSCPIAAKPINTALAELAAGRCLAPLSPFCKEVELLQSPADQRVSLVLLLRKKQEIPPPVLQAIADCSSIHACSCKAGKYFSSLIPLPETKKKEPEPLSQQVTIDELPDCTLSWSAGCFSQVNPAQNQQLIQLVCTLAGNLQGKTILDLYCGMGNFSIPLALCGGTVTGIEWNRESIRWAEINAESAGITASFFAADVTDSLRQLVKDRQHVDLIVLDPPRKGIGAAAALLPALEPEKIIYISCDPATLARDLAILCRKGYALIKLMPVDMFPQTHHIESVVLLEKTDMP
jgi:23S rRNA (uracil1939-C5)-methyltransferase